MTSQPASDPKGQFEPGAKVGPFEIVRVIGAGAQGVVYEAQNAEGGRLALKVIHRHLLGDTQIFKRFHREAAILKRLEGEHLVQFVDFLEIDGLLIIALEYVDAMSLEDMLGQSAGSGTSQDKAHPLDLKIAVEIALQICAALGLAHASGVVHRDLKPANVLVERGAGAGEPLRVRVVDFGLAKVLHGEQMSTGLTEQDMIFGTPEYMAPEQARGDDCDGRADLYAAGIMLYEMIVGKVPFHARTPLATMTAHLTEEPPPPRSSAPGLRISPALEVVIQRSLAKNPDDRYPTGRAFAEALVAARDQTVVITPRKVADADALSVGDTDLHVSTTGIGIAKTLPELPKIAFDREIESRLRPADPIVQTQKSPAIPAAAPISKPSSTRLPAQSSRGWVWAVVAIVAAVVGVAIGALVGAR